MARFKIKAEFRNRLSEKLMDLGNFAAVGMIIGQFATNKEFSISLALAGIIVTISCYIGSYILVL